MLSLRERLVLLVVAAILPLAALSIWSAVREASAARAAARAQLQFAASLVAANQDRAIEAAEHLLGAIATMDGLQKVSRADCAQFFASLRGRYPVYANAGLTDRQGNVLCNATSASDYSIADRPYFRRAMAQYRFTVGSPTVGRGSGRPSIPFAQPYYTGDELAGVVFVALDMQLASLELRRLQLPGTGRVTVTDALGRVAFAHPALEAGAVQVAGTRIVEAAARMVSGGGEWTDTDGVERIHAFSPIRRIGEEGFLAVVSLDSNEVVGATIDSLRSELLALTLVLLLGAAGASVLANRMIVRPASQILEAVRRAEQGDLDARVPAVDTSPRGEFARIGGAFNLMAGALQQRQGELEAELSRSRDAHSLLHQVLNGMHDALLAVKLDGTLMMYNEAAAAIFPIDRPALDASRWAREFGCFHADGVTLYRPDELPLVQALRGGSGSQKLMLVRNASVPKGRMLQCSWQPIHGAQGQIGALVVCNDVTALHRLQAEQAEQYAELRQTQRKLIDAHRIGRIGNWEYDVRNRRLWWSFEAYELFGVTPETFEPLLENVKKLVHPDDLERIVTSFPEAVRAGRQLKGEYRIVKPDGSVAWIYQIAGARRDADGRATWIAGVVQDVTERRSAEDSLRARERELQEFTRMLQRTAEAAAAITAQPTLHATLQQLVDDVRTIIPSAFAIVMVSPGDDDSAATALSRAAGFDQSQPFGLVGSSAACAFTPEANKCLRLTREEVARHPYLATCSERERGLLVGGLLCAPLVGRDGAGIGFFQLANRLEGDFTERDEYVAMEIAQLASTAIANARLFAEVTELNASLETRIAERTAELTQQERLYRTLAEQAPEIVWNIDTSGNATFVNRAWYDLVGGTPKDWLGRGWLDAVHPDDLDEMRTSWAQAREWGRPYAGMRRFHAKDGSYHTMSYRAAPVFDDAGEISFWVGIDTDISALKTIEQALRDSNLELEAFSYSVSHDLRAPLGAIAGFSKALALRLGDQVDERGRHFLQRIEAGARKMEQLIEALLSLSRVTRAEFHWRPVDLTAMARDAIDELQTQSPDRVVRVWIDEGLATLGDERMLRVLMQNLVSNAWKFTGRRDDAVIEVGRDVMQDAFYVRDNGVGFDMAYAGKLFNAFQRLHTDAQFPGTGIGLATVRRIVTRHLGRVWADSAEGVGTTFYFTLSETAPPAWTPSQL